MRPLSPLLCTIVHFYSLYTARWRVIRSIAAFLAQSRHDDGPIAFTAKYGTVFAPLISVVTAKVSEMLLLLFLCTGVSWSLRSKLAILCDAAVALR